MKLSQACIDRPVLATVMSLVIVLFGALSLARLPNRELPDVDSPVVSVTTVFPGAAPEVVETSVTQPLEDQLIGIDGVKHLTSNSREEVSSISIEFELSRDLEAAANDVRDRVARSRNQLPEEIDEPITAKRDADANAILWIAVSSATHTQIELSQIVESQIEDRLAKLAGVSDVLVSGDRRYSMRVWIDNARLTAHGLTVADVADALRRENVDIPSGRVESSDREYTVRSLGELQTVAGYESLIVATANGEPVRLRDVARVEVGPEDERKIVRFDGVPAIGLGIVKQSKANTLDVADRVRAELERLSAELPPGVEVAVAFDASTFIRESIRDVTRTIFEAIVLVVLVIYLFLRSIRATIIPAVAIPISIVGSFAVLYALGFTINTLTLMGITLAIGLVVDDAIVVLENVTRWIEQGASPLQASRRGIEEISFAVVAATISAVAVFVPLTFLEDTTGRLFREFAVTVAAALLISGFVALTLSPALCALVLRRAGPERGVKAFLAAALQRLGDLYVRALEPVLARPLPAVVFGLLWVLLGAALYRSIDQELMPEADRNFVMARVEAPEGSTIDYTNRYQRQVERVVAAEPEVARMFSAVPLGLGAPNVVNVGGLFVSLVPAEERERDQGEMVDALRERFREIAGVEAIAFGPSPLSGFGGAPVQMVVQGPDVIELARHADVIASRLEAIPGFENLRTNLYLNKPQVEVSIDRERASDLGVSVREIAATLQTLLGGRDLSTFKLGGETYDVMVQLPRAERADPADLLGLYVRSSTGRLVPLISVVQTSTGVAPRELPHFDRRRSVTIEANLSGLAQGDALGIARAVAEEALRDAPGYSVTFAGESEQFFQAGNALAFAYGLAILIVYLVLAAQFESFVHPFTILVAVALSFTGALLALSFAGFLPGVEPQTLNLFSKIGLVMLVGLVTKNSILIVEFANQLRERGLGLAEATLEASRTRFRPILMTALATMVGIAPIAAGLGAGGESRAPLGIAVVGGMFFSTLFTFFVAPATYLAVESLRAGLAARRAPAPAGAPPLGAGSRS